MSRLTRLAGDGLANEKLPEDDIKLFKQCKFDTIVGFSLHYGIAPTLMADYVKHTDEQVVDPSYYKEMVIQESSTGCNFIALQHLLDWSDLSGKPTSLVAEKMRTYCETRYLHKDSFLRLIGKSGRLSLCGKSKLKRIFFRLV